MAIDAGCTHVIIGHSERRQFFGETDETVNKKVHAALEVRLLEALESLAGEGIRLKINQDGFPIKTVGNDGVE